MINTRETKMDQRSDSKNVPNFNVRQMKVTDIDQCLEIWAKVNLSEARQTVQSCFLLEPEAFYVAVLDETDHVVGMCAGPVVRNDTAFMGFYGVDPQYQGLGIGRELWAKTLGRLSPTLNKGLYGVPEMSDKYKKAGFIFEDKTTMLVFEGKPNELPKIDCLRTLSQLNPDLGAELHILSGDSSEIDLFNQLVTYDEFVHGFSREPLLRQYLQGIDIPFTVLITGGPESKQMLGYGIVREDNNGGAIIGPIYAESDEIGEVILRELMSNSKLQPGKVFSVMPLSSNRSAIEMLLKVGLVEMEECSRLFTKFVPDVKLSKVYYVFSPNFSLY